MKTKKIVIFCLCLLMLIASGCGAANDPAVAEADPAADNRWGVTMVAEDITANGLTLIITRTDDSDWQVITGQPFTLEVLQNGAWQPYERSDGLMIDFAWEDIGYLVTADTPLTLETDWQWLHGTLPAGSYRLTKEFTASLDNDRDPPHDKFTLSVEFRIV